MHWTPRRERFRALLAEARVVHPASVYDAISARIAEDLGFEAGMFAGSVASLAVLGAPDLILVTLTEFAAQAYRINRAGNLPLLVDSDHGYGNALNVKRTVEELETAGVAALTIEDTLLPRPFGSDGRARLIPLEEGVGKMKAALAGRQDKSLVIAARTSALAIAGVAEAVRRARAYAETGVDALFLAGATARAEIEAVAAAVKIPLLLGGSGGDLADPDFLAAHNVKIALQGHAPFAAAVQAVHDTLKALREGVPPRALKNLASPELMRQLTRAADYQAWTRAFLGGA
jgi:carboxyvinyl-carboxyphosphonate phosphorylmutase